MHFYSGLEIIVYFDWECHTYVVNLFISESNGTFLYIVHLVRITVRRINNWEHQYWAQKLQGEGQARSGGIIMEASGVQGQVFGHQLELYRSGHVRMSLNNKRINRVSIASFQYCMCYHRRLLSLNQFNIPAKQRFNEQLGCPSPLNCGHWSKIRKIVWHKQ